MISCDSKVQPPAEPKPPNSVESEPSNCGDSKKDAEDIVPPYSKEVKSGNCQSDDAGNDPTVCPPEAKNDEKGQNIAAENETIVSHNSFNLDSDEPISPAKSAETERKEAAADSVDVSAEPEVPRAKTESRDDNNASEVFGSNTQPNSPLGSQSKPQPDGTAVIEAATIDSSPQKTLPEVKDKSAAKVASDASSPPLSVQDDFEGSDDDSFSDDDEDIHVGRLRRRSSVSEEEEEVDEYEDDFTDEGDYSEEETMEDEFEDEEEEGQEGALSELDEQAKIDDEKVQNDSDQSIKQKDMDLSPPAHTVTFSAAIDAAEKEGRIVDENKPEAREQGAIEEEKEEENKKNPAYVPRSGAYYMHDVRNDGSASDEEGNAAQNTTKRVDRRPGIMADRWQHDRFDARLQAPPTEEELIYRYGYNIRKHGFDEVPDTKPATEATTSDAPDTKTGCSKLGTSRSGRTPRKTVSRGGTARSSGSGGHKNVPVDSTPTDVMQAPAEQRSKVASRETETTRNRGVREGTRSDRGKDLDVYPSAPRSGNLRASFTRSSTAEDGCQVQVATNNQRTRTRQMDNYEDRSAPRYNWGAVSHREKRSGEQYDGNDVNHTALRDETCRGPVDGSTYYRTPPGSERRQNRRRSQRYDDASHQNADDRRLNHDTTYRAYPNNNRAVGPLRYQNYPGRYSSGEDVNPKDRGSAIAQSSSNRHLGYYDDYNAPPPSQHRTSDLRCDLRYEQRNQTSANFRNEPDDSQGHSGRRFNQSAKFGDEIRHGSGYRQDRHQPLAQASRGDGQPSDDSYNRKPGYRPGRYGSRSQPSEVKKSHHNENSDRDNDRGFDYRSERYQPRIVASEVIGSSQASGRIGHQDRNAGRVAGRHSSNQSSDLPSNHRFQHGRTEEQLQAPTQRAKRYSTIRQTPKSSGPGGQDLEPSESHRPPQTSSSPTDRMPPLAQKTVLPEPQSTATTSPSKPTVRSTPTPDSTLTTEQASNSTSKPPPTSPAASKDVHLLTSSMNAVRLGQPNHSITYSPVGLGGSFPAPAGAQFSAGDPEIPPLDYYRSIDPALVAAVLNQQHALAQAVNNAAMNRGPTLTPPHSLPAQPAPPSTMGGFPMSPAGDAYYGVATMPVDARAIGQLYSVPPPLVGTTPPFRQELQPTNATGIPGGRPILGNRPKRSLEVKDPSSGTTTPPSSSQVKAV
ncbi:unnamed protein product [Schistocephalus solidus]|uniref:Protein CASC3 n=1 Tax=Schistocephalus solidus TaxID=70667 RepID=A0A183TCV3_SCHSO|nr:unnamed protein product [Schistocephalus solidus]